MSESSKTKTAHHKNQRSHLQFVSVVQPTVLRPKDIQFTIIQQIIKFEKLKPENMFCILA